MMRGSKPVNLAGLFAALADATRLRLLNLMGGREVCVCYFVEILRQGQPKISRHLAYLRRAGLVAARREGKWMHYRIVAQADEAAASILAAVLAAAGDCCSTRHPVDLEGSQFCAVGQLCVVGRRG
jgi:ArsR family transcriptional regulator